MSDQEPQEIEIKIGPARYPSEGAKMLHLVGRKEVFPLFEEKLNNPQGVQEVLELRSCRWLFEEVTYWEYLVDEANAGTFDEDNKWHGEPPEKIIDKMRADVRENWGESFDIEAQIIERVSKEIDSQDNVHAQMFLVKEKGDGSLNDSAYRCLVVYPPEIVDDKHMRRREYSTLTMGCQTINFALLMKGFPFLDHSQWRDFLKIVEVNGQQNLVARFKIGNIDRDELSERMKRHEAERSIADTAVRTILNVNDRLHHRKGKHIDVAKAARSAEYALDYAFAAHLGLPEVIAADKSNLPPIVIE